MSDHPPTEPVADLVRRGLEEDLGAADLTTRALVPPDSRGRAEIRAKAEGVMAGAFAAAEVFRQTGADYETTVDDGRSVGPGAHVARVKGDLTAILAAERTALNLLARLSGIATLTARFVAAVKGAPARILDTRKTTPLYRALEKYAVRMGGGTNHRRGLADEVLVKENHIAAARVAGSASGFDAAVRLLTERVPPGTVVGIEVTDLSELHIALEAGPDYVLCDNFALEDLELAVKVRNGWPGGRRSELEASGGIRLDNVALVAATGVERISVGALTHSAPALDLSLEVQVDS